MFTIANAAARYVLADIPDDATADYLADKIEDAAWEIFDRPMFAGIDDSDHEEAMMHLTYDIADVISKTTDTTRAVRAAALALLA